MAKKHRKLTKGERVGFEVLNGIRDIKRGRCKTYVVETTAKQARKPARRAA